MHNLRVPGGGSGPGSAAERRKAHAEQYRPVVMYGGGKQTQSSMHYGGMMMSKLLGLVRNERGAEMVEWVVVVASLAAVGLLVFGSGGILQNALNTGINKISSKITALP